MSEVDARPSDTLSAPLRAELRKTLLTRFSETNKLGEVASGRLTLPDEYGGLC